jgi:hypothetical protein
MQRNPEANLNQMQSFSLIEDYIKKLNINNSLDLQKDCEKCFSEKGILLHEFPNVTSRLFEEVKEKAVENSRYNSKKGRGILERCSRVLSHKEAEAKSRYIEQPPKKTILSQLENRGFVEPNYQLSCDDINTMLKFNPLEDENIEYRTPISLTDDDGAALREYLEYNDFDKKLLIPVNIHNHWVLLIREVNDNDQLIITCWNPSVTSILMKKKINNILDKLQFTGEIKGSKVNYIDAKEQTDGFTCGYRVVRKAFEEADIVNSLTRVEPTEPNKMCHTFAKMMFDPNTGYLSKDELCITEGNSPVIYLKSKEEEAKKVDSNRQNKVKTQTESDERLAFVLQHIYDTIPDIKDADALKLAERKSNTLKKADFDQIKNEVGTFKQRFFNDHSPGNKTGKKNDGAYESKKGEFLKSSR